MRCKPRPPFSLNTPTIPWTIQDGTRVDGPSSNGLVVPPLVLVHSFRPLQEDSFPSSRGPDGRFRPLQQVLPMEEASIGGWNVPQPSLSVPPPPPPKDGVYTSVPPSAPSPISPHLLQTGYPFVNIPTASPAASPRAPRQSVDSVQLSRLTAVERSRSLKLTRMHPYLQFMCGPLLRYDTMDEHGMWHGAALIVSELLIFRPGLLSVPLTSHLAISCRRWFYLRAISGFEVFLGPRAAPFPA
jgi:hypothetical protein